MTGKIRKTSRRIGCCMYQREKSNSTKFLRDKLRRRNDVDDLSKLLNSLKLEDKRRKRPYRRRRTISTPIRRTNDDSSENFYFFPKTLHSSKGCKHLYDLQKSSNNNCAFDLKQVEGHKFQFPTISTQQFYGGGPPRIKPKSEVEKLSAALDSMNIEDEDV